MDPNKAPSFLSFGIETNGTQKDIASGNLMYAANARPKALSTGSDKPLYTKRGNASVFENNKYNITQHMYPEDLMSSSGEYGSNYVVFYINVAEDSKLIKDNKDLVVNDIPPRDLGEAVANVDRDLPKGPEGELQRKLIIGGGVSAANGVIAGIGGGYKAGFTAAGITGAAAGVAASQGASFTGQKKRIKTAVSLHIPNNLATKYSVNYEEESTAFQMMGIKFGAEALQKAAASSNAMGNLGAAVANIGLSLPGTGLLSKLGQIAPNPRKEQIFKRVDFRTFQFDYEFFPRSETEAQNVLDIIKQFKYHMHPEFKDDNAFLYIYPSEFDIYYYHGVDENLTIHRHTSCVLEDLSVNYSPQGQFTTFSNGMPTQINISMQFKELALLTKEKIEDGL